MNFAGNFLLFFIFNMFYCKRLYIHQEYPFKSRFFQLTISFDKYFTLLSINTFNNYTWLPMSVKNDFKKLNTTLIGTISVSHKKNTKVPAIIYSVPLRFLNDDIVIYDYYMFIKDIQIWDVCNSGIGFAYKFNNYNYSIIHKLYDNNYIKDKQFSFIQRTTKTKGEIVIGSLISQYDIDKLNYKGKCNVIKTNSYWSCGIYSIKYENEIFDNNGDIIEVGFHSVMKYSINSKHLVKMIQKVMKDKCNEAIYNVDENRLLCDKKSIDDSKYNIIFDFGFQIEIPLHILFQCDDDKNETCLSTFLYMNNDTSVSHILNPSTSIIFGSPFLKMFKIVTFNYDDNSITFYSDQFKIISSSSYIKHNYNNRLKIIYIELYLLFPFILIHLILKYYINNYLKNNTN